MTTPTARPSSRRGRVALDVLSLLLVLAGAIGLAGVAFTVHDLAGWAVVSAYTIAAGLFVGVDR